MTAIPASARPAARSPEVIVVGLGAVGAATLYQLARRGIPALGIDRFTPPHAQGSSHGETRVTRVATGEGAAYVAFARRSHEIWRELEAETGQTLLRLCGFLMIDGSGGAALRHGKPGFFDTTVGVAEREGVPHERLSADEVMRRYPTLALTGAERCFFEPGAGVAYPERAIAAQLARAAAMGAQILNDTVVTAIEPDGAGVTVRTAVGAHRAARAVIAAGAWTPGLIGAPLARMQLLRQVLHWFAPAPADYGADRFPTFLWLDGPSAEDMVYGFPVLPDLPPTLKAATEQYTDAISRPEAMERDVAPDEPARMFSRYIEGRLLGIDRAAARSASCLYTHAPDGDFVLDYHVGSDRVLIVSACSGHGFKHSAAVGEATAATVIGERALNPAFALTRFALRS